MKGGTAFLLVLLSVTSVLASESFRIPPNTIVFANGVQLVGDVSVEYTHDAILLGGVPVFTLGDLSAAKYRSYDFYANAFKQWRYFDGKMVTAQNYRRYIDTYNEDHLQCVLSILREIRTLRSAGHSGATIEERIAQYIQSDFGTMFESRAQIDDTSATLYSAYIDGREMPSTYPLDYSGPPPEPGVEVRYDVLVKDLRNALSLGDSPAVVIVNDGSVASVFLGRSKTDRLLSEIDTFLATGNAGEMLPRSYLEKIKSQRKGE